MITARERQRGFGIAAAIFILLVLAVLGAFIVSVSTTQHAGAALDVQGTETYRSARSGIEWGVYKVLNDASYACVTTIGTITTDIGVISGMQVTVVCNHTTADEVKSDGTTPVVNLYEVTATACNLPNAGSPNCPGTNNISNPNYVERQIRVMVEN